MTSGGKTQCNFLLAGGATPNVSARLRLRQLHAFLRRVQIFLCPKYVSASHVSSALAVPIVLVRQFHGSLSERPLGLIEGDVGDREIGE